MQHDGGCSLLVEKLKQCDVVDVVADGVQLQTNGK